MTVEVNDRSKGKCFTPNFLCISKLLSAMQLAHKLLYAFFSPKYHQYGSIEMFIFVKG